MNLHFPEDFMSLSLDQFGKAAIAAHLVTADELKTLWTSLAPEARPKDGEALARLLVERGKLSETQAKQLGADLGGEPVNEPVAAVSSPMLSKSPPPESPPPPTPNKRKPPVGLIAGAVAGLTII